MRWVAALALLALSACATASVPAIDIREVTDPAAMAKAESACAGYALSHKSALSLASIGNQTMQGGLNNLAGAAINPLVPAAGAAGGAGAELLREFGLMNLDQRHVYVKCLTLKGERSGAFLVVEPD